MNKEALQKRYPNGIPEDLQEGVSYFETLSQKSGVRSVRLMSNFSKDLEHSLIHKTNVYKGIIVQVASNYELSESDRAWFHPELSKARSLYEGKHELPNGGELGEINSLAGTYSTYTVDEVGGQTVNYYTVVDSAAPALPQTTVNHWIVTRSSMKDVYSDYKTNKNDGETLQQAGQSLRDKIGGTPTLTNEYISLFKGANSYHFYNHVIKSLIHTHVMRMGDTVKGEPYRMVKAVFSANKVMGLLDASTTLQLTPTRANIPEGVSCDEYTERDIIPFALKEETVHKVMKDHWRSLISSKFIRGDKLLLPRAMVEKSLI